MKKIGIFHQLLSNVISGPGHLDTIVVADAGLPMPSDTRRIDLALTNDIPGFIDTVQVVLAEMQVERALVAEELLTNSPYIYQKLQEQLLEIPSDAISHTELKQRTGSANAVVRTGEFTPCTKVFHTSGVIF